MFKKSCVWILILAMTLSSCGVQSSGNQASENSSGNAEKQEQSSQGESLPVIISGAETSDENDGAEQEQANTIEQAVAEVNQFTDFDLDPAHYESAEHFANEVLKQASLYGNTKKAQAFLETAYAVWPNPRILAAEKELVKGQWKQTVQYVFNADEAAPTRYTVNEYDASGNLIRETSYDRADDSMQTYHDGSQMGEFRIDAINIFEYDENNRQVLEKGISSYQSGGESIYLSPAEMEEKLGRNEDVLIYERIEYDAEGRKLNVYGMDSTTGSEYRSSYWEYDPTGRAAIEHFLNYEGEPTRDMVYEYSSVGSLIRTAEVYPEDGVTTETLYTFDEFGQAVKCEVIYQGALYSVEEYSYDVNGMKTRTVYNRYNRESGSVEEYYEIDYDGNGNQVSKYQEMRSDNMILADEYRTYTYNEGGLYTECRTYRKQDDSLKRTATREYLYMPLE